MTGCGMPDLNTRANLGKGPFGHSGALWRQVRFFLLFCSGQSDVPIGPTGHASLGLSEIGRARNELWSPSNHKTLTNVTSVRHSRV